MDNTYFTREKPELSMINIHVFVNQAGYFPNQKKNAVINVPTAKFSVVDEKGISVFSGMTSHFGFDENSGDNIFIADFSELKQVGKYHVRTDNGESSLEFEISKQCYDKVFFDLTKAFYFLRCGCQLEEKYAGKFTHGECHTEKAVLYENNGVKLDVSGGWHDAGDYGRYVTAAACALAHLFYAYRLFKDEFTGLDLNIPESKSKIPDILSECRYELEWLLKMQRGDGGVYHKATTECHAPFIMPENDKAQMYVFPVSSMATADFAAVAAMASRLYREYDLDFADKLFCAAEHAYEWLENNPEFVGFENPEGCNTGAYGEAADNDNRFWAAVEMYCADGEEKYHSAVKKQLEKEFDLAGLGFSETGGFGALSYILCEREEKDKKLSRIFFDKFVWAARYYKDTADKCGYGAAMETSDYCWGSNMNLLKHAMIFAIAEIITGEKLYGDYAAAQFDYLMGVNATGYSYVTENGGLSCKNPHLRPTYADGVEECIPGLVSGGANGTPCDIDAEILVPQGTPPMKCFVDDVGCYSLNEITIYWNSPAVFLAAYLKNKFNNE